MRELKFRVWDEKYHCWDNSLIICYPNEVFKKQGRTIQWSTGIEDQNGNPIYEGDILEYNHGNGINVGYVGFTSGIFFLNYSDENNDELGYLLVSNIKIIGNIFENKELLK